MRKSVKFYLSEKDIAALNQASYILTELKMCGVLTGCPTIEDIATLGDAEMYDPNNGFDARLENAWISGDIYLEESSSQK